MCKSVAVLVLKSVSAYFSYVYASANHHYDSVVISVWRGKGVQSVSAFKLKLSSVG